MFCYYQGCTKRSETKEHIPPKSFFPKDQRNQLLTVPSCKDHNNAKSSDDTYVLAQICMNASPSNQSRKIFMDRVVPQLGYNSGSLREILVKDSVTQPDGTVAYPVNRKRFDHFFTSLSCGIICKSCKKSLPINYSIQHIYHDFYDSKKSPQEENIELMLLNFYTGKPMEAMDFGQVNALNTSVYSVKIFGVPNFRSSITIVHKFFGAFRVTSMLTNTGKH